jgi:hypothetical protein
MMKQQCMESAGLRYVALRTLIAASTHCKGHEVTIEKAIDTVVECKLEYQSQLYVGIFLHPWQRPATEV